MTPNFPAADGDVTDSSVDEETTCDVVKSIPKDSEENSQASSEVIESEPSENEVQSAKTYPKGSVKF